MNRAVFLDRDGVINPLVRRDSRFYPPARLEEFNLFPGVEEALSRLRSAQYLLIITTNQPDVATGVMTRYNLDKIHDHLQRNLPVDEIKVCCHIDPDRCSCRKPLPGMLLDAARHWSVDLNRSLMVGDRWRDMGAGNSAQCRTILIGEDSLATGRFSPDASARSLVEATDLILSWDDN